MSDDGAEYFAPRDSVERVMADPEATYRDKLIALRDYVAHELEGNRCKTCFNSKLRTGDTAALVLRLKTLLDDIESVPDPNQEVDEFDALIAREPDWASAPKNLPPAPGGD